MLFRFAETATPHYSAHVMFPCDCITVIAAICQYTAVR